MTSKLTQAASSWLKTAAKIGLALGILGWMINKGFLDRDTFAKLLTPQVGFFAAGLTFMQIFVNNFRWLALMRGQGIESNVRQTLPLSFIGMFFNFVMPGGVGGDVVKGYYLLQDFPQRKFAAAVSIFMDRMMGFFVMIATAFLALFFNWDKVSHSKELQSIGYAVTLLFVGFLVFYFLSLSTLLQRSALGKLLFEKLPGGAKLRTIYDALHSYRKAPGALVLSIILSGFNQLFIIAFFYTIAKAMGYESIPLSVYFFLVPIGIVVQALPISPAGIGVGQAAFFYLFNLYLGEKSQFGPTAVTCMQALSLLWGLFGAYFFLQRKKPAQLESNNA